jgi:predicted transcriptional regulator
MGFGVRDDLRAVLEKLSGEELLATRHYLERMLEERGIDPYAHLDADYELDEEERVRLHASIERGLAEMRAGKGRPAEEVLAELRSRR